MEQPTQSSRGAARTPGAVLVLGEPAGLGTALIRRLEQEGAAATAGLGLTDSQIASALADDQWRAVAVVSRDDALALRLTLLSAHVRPDLPLWVTMFDRTVARELHHLAPRIQVVSPSEIVADHLVQHLFEERETEKGLVRRRHGLKVVDDALRLLLAAGAGLFASLLFEVAITVLAFDEHLVDALYFSTRTVATVDGPPDVATGAEWFKLLSAANMVVAIVLVAIFTAALVRRLSHRRLTTLVGPRSAPGKNHVILVGFGQVGFRFAQVLRERGVAVIAIERNQDAPCVRLARAAGIPVAIGRGDDRETLQRVGIAHCAAVAAVTSDDLVNVAVGLAARDMRPGLSLVLRLGDGEVASETDSLLHLGSICDAHKLAAATIARSFDETMA